MPRKARGSKGNETYHIVVQGKRGTRLFEEDEDKRIYLEKLRIGCEERGAGLLAYAILPDHLHLVVAENGGTVSGLMRSVHVMFTALYRKRHGLPSEDAIIRDRFRSERIESDRRLMEVIWHIHREAVMLGLCERAEAYPWSSAAVYAKAEKEREERGSGIKAPKVDTSRLLSILHFGGGYESFARSPLTMGEAVLEEVPESYGRSDEEATLLIEKHLGGASVVELRRWPEEEKRAFVKMVRKEEKIGILQLCRITGMSRGIVQRL